jgi:hypothetical protein
MVSVWGIYPVEYSFRLGNVNYYEDVLRLSKNIGLIMYNAEQDFLNNTITKERAVAELDLLIAVDSLYPAFRRNWKAENLNLPDGTPFRGTWEARYNLIQKVFRDPETLQRWKTEKSYIPLLETAYQRELDEEEKLKNELLKTQKEQKEKREKIIQPEIIATSSLIPIVAIGYLVFKK